MKHLNKDSTSIFCALIDRLNGTDYLKIENEPYMPLTIERVGNAYNNEAGLYSLNHFYTQNGDLMRDPEVGFIVVDHRTETDRETDNLRVIPYLFRQDNLGVYEESIFMRDGVVIRCNDKEQQDITGFSNEWLSNIELQGF